MVKMKGCYLIMFRRGCACNIGSDLYFKEFVICYCGRVEQTHYQSNTVFYQNVLTLLKKCCHGKTSQDRQGRTKTHIDCQGPMNRGLFMNFHQEGFINRLLCSKYIYKIERFVSAGSPTRNVKELSRA